jgi:hypothetical protein
MSLAPATVPAPYTFRAAFATVLEPMRGGTEPRMWGTGWKIANGFARSVSSPPAALSRAVANAWPDRGDHDRPRRSPAGSWLVQPEVD